MDELDYVETSDPEELEISYRLLDLPRQREAQVIAHATSPDPAFPRKRRKIFHVALDGKSDATSELTSPTLIDGKSMTPVPSSPGPPTSTKALDDEWLSPAAPLSFKKKNTQEFGNVGLGMFSQDGGTLVDVFRVPQRSPSQDELDVISQPITQPDAGFPGYIAALRTSNTSHGETRPMQTTDNKEHQEQNSCGLFLSLLSQDGTLSIDRALSRDEFNFNSPERHSAVAPRFSSLPPSSPPHASSTIFTTPPRSVSHSPDRRERSDNIGSTIQRGDSDTDLYSAFEGHDGMAPRRYSLRARQARQLNPYEYDKRLYKQQMKRLPDAIVKIVSPQRHGPGRSHRHRESEEDDDFIVADDDDESQEAKRRRSVAQKSAEIPNEDGGRNLGWLPQLFHMSDDEDLTPLSPLENRESPKTSASGELGGKHKARQRAIKFPLKEARIRSADSPGRRVDREIPAVGHPAITYMRRKDIRSSPKRAEERSDNGNMSQRWTELSGHPSPSSEASLRVSSEATLGTSRDGDTGSKLSQHEEDRRAFDVDDYNVYETLNDDDFDGASHVSDSRHNADEDESSPSLHSQSEVLTDYDDKLARKMRKAERALGYLYPKSMINKGYFDKKLVPVEDRSRSRVEPVASGEESNTEDDVSLAPGQSRITKRSNAHRADQEIKGDTESSDSDTVIDVTDVDPTNVIHVESSSDSETSTASSLHGDDEDILENSVAETGYFDQDYSRQLGHRREEPLIDMMLSRTRAKRFSSKAEPRRSKSGTSGVRRLRTNGLDVDVSRSSSQPGPRNHRSGAKQTRFRPQVAAVVDQSGDEHVIDLTNMEVDREDVEEHDDGIPVTESPEAPKRLTKKQRREAVQKATVHTFTSSRKKIGSGRRKGFITVQIDLADAGFRNAIKPLHREDVPQSRPAFSRIPSRKVIDKAPYRPRHLADNRESLKQISLHNFGFNDATVGDSFEHGDPMHQPAYAPATPEWHDEDRIRTCSIDMGVSIPTPGLAFGATTYLGKQLLPDLLNFAFDNGALSRPGPYSGFGTINLDSEMPINSFAEAVDVACNVLYEWLDEDAEESTDEDNVRRHDHLMHSVSHFTAWMYANTNADGRKTVQTALVSCVERLSQRLQEIAERKPAMTYVDNRRLTVMWFLVESATRLLASARRQSGEMDTALWKAAVSLLAETLVDYSVERTLTAIEKRDLSSSSTELRTAELWVCMIHLLSQTNFPGTSSADVGVFWSVLLQVLKSNGSQAISDIGRSEHLWKIVFGLCALSHFSPHGIATSEPRLVPCWDVVGIALDTIRLTHDEAVDSKVPRQSLRRRDRYLRMVVARCWVLGTRWKWPLRDAHVVFKKLVDIFRSRNFGNLVGEGSEFPGFLRYQDIALLNELQGNDTAFGVYLKLVMQAAKVDPEGSRNDNRTRLRLMKLLSLVVPLSGVPSSSEKAPTTGELSMIINRFSAIIIAILVDGKENANVQYRVDQAHRFVDFVVAHNWSRNVCIKAAMHMAVVAGHLSLELAAPLRWLGEMCETLLEEFQTSSLGPAKEPAASKSDDVQLRRGLVISLHLVLGCVTNIIEKPHLQTQGPAPRYPDVHLISGPWVKRVFPMKELTNIVTTRDQILRLVQSFLKARGDIFPPPRRHTPSSADTDPESQDLFAEFLLDDEALASVPLGDGSEDNWARDKEVAKIMNSDIIPHIFRLLLQYFNDPTARPSDESKLELFWSGADDWIDCWVGCAAVVVRNGIRNWDHYLNVGPQSWAGIGDSFFRRRVAIRFMYQLLKCDPTACKAHERHFLTVLLQCLVAYRITVENEYLSTLLSIDGLRHPILRELPVERASEQEEYRLSRSDFLEKRESIIAGIFNNLNSILLSDSSERDKNILVECVLEMLSAMQDIWTNFSSAEDREKYGDLCRYVFSEIGKHPRVRSLQRLSNSVAWGTSFTGPGI